MSKKDGEATRIADLLGTHYVHAVRLLREARKDLGDDASFTDLALACRGMYEAEEKARTAKNRTLGAAKRRPRGVLPKGAGGVRCGDCDAFACADGKGTPIVLKHDDGCPEKYPIKDHRYDAGNPRDDSKGCIHDYALHSGDEPQICTRSLSEHAHSEYPEDYR